MLLIESMARIRFDSPERRRALKRLLPAKFPTLADRIGQREAKYLAMFLGAYDFPELSYREIGVTDQVSQQRVSQIIHRGVKKLEAQ